MEQQHAWLTANEIKESTREVTRSIYPKYNAWITRSWEIWRDVNSLALKKSNDGNNSILHGYLIRDLSLDIEKFVYTAYGRLFRLQATVHLRGQDKGKVIMKTV